LLNRGDVINQTIIVRKYGDIMKMYQDEKFYIKKNQILVY